MSGQGFARYNVLFICRDNSARSLFAEATLNRFGGGKFNAFSGGLTPAAEMHPMAEQVLRTQNFRTDRLRPKPFRQFVDQQALAFDFVFALDRFAPGELPSAWPGTPLQASWPIDDPALVEGTPAAVGYAYADAYRTAYNRSWIFSNLPIEGLDRLALSKKLDDIGTAREQHPELADLQSQLDRLAVALGEDSGSTLATRFGRARDGDLAAGAGDGGE